MRTVTGSGIRWLELAAIFMLFVIVQISADETGKPTTHFSHTIIINIILFDFSFAFIMPIYCVIERERCIWLQGMQFIKESRLNLPLTGNWRAPPPSHLVPSRSGGLFILLMFSPHSIWMRLQWNASLLTFFSVKVYWFVVNVLQHRMLAKQNPEPSHSRNDGKPIKMTLVLHRMRVRGDKAHHTHWSPVPHIYSLRNIYDYWWPIQMIHSEVRERINSARNISRTLRAQVQESRFVRVLSVCLVRLLSHISAFANAKFTAQCDFHHFASSRSMCSTTNHKWHTIKIYLWILCKVVGRVEMD